MEFSTISISSPFEGSIFSEMLKMGLCPGLASTLDSPSFSSWNNGAFGMTGPGFWFLAALYVKPRKKNSFVNWIQQNLKSILTNEYWYLRTSDHTTCKHQSFPSCCIVFLHETNDSVKYNHCRQKHDWRCDGSTDRHFDGDFIVTWLPWNKFCMARSLALSSFSFVQKLN